MKGIYLIGFMGSGKTSVAISLSDKLQLPVQDTDQMIVDYTKSSIASIFDRCGEETFRNYESEMLKRTEGEGKITSTGGGIVERESNCDWLRRNGLVFYLDTSWDVILDRLKDDKSRPIWNNNQRDKRKLLESRIPKYEATANYVIKTDGKDPEAIADEMIALINAPK
ncbi:shikimate kinase [Aquibacillus kalidii]|uniref:shikimate kinase n=1 Tax=Aquibacillus kalidii TaxID=2762597 RepID=UPI0016489C47|nr:shikimate kinase [Aquibacillus kalidii]